MHNNRIKGKWLAVLAVLIPWMAWAQVPPPVVRNVLDTNLVAFGTTGQALFRITALPLINWSNILQAIGITNVINSIVGTSNNLYILKLDGVGTNTTIYGSPAGTNWTVTGPGGFLNTNVAGGMILGVNGRLIISANGTTTGIASNLVGGLTLGHTNDQRAYLTIGLTNGSGITNQYAILVTTNGKITNPIFSLETNGNGYFTAGLEAGGSVTGTRMQAASGNGIRIGTSASDTMPYLKHLSGTASWQVLNANSTGSPSNNLFVAGGGTFSNGIVAKIHSTYGPSTNIVPLVIIPNAGAATNFFEVQDTNGTPIFVISSNSVDPFVGIGTNLPAAPLHIVSTNVSGKLLVVQSNTSGTATLIVTNGRVGIGKNDPGYPLDVSGFISSGSLYALSLIRCGSAGPVEWNSRSRLYSPFDSYVSFVSQAGTDAIGLIFGTNSIAAPASGPTNAAPMLKKARQFSAPATHVPGFKLTDQSDGTNGCFLELKSVSSANTNKLVPEAASVIHFATTNGTPDGKAEAWITEESGRMFRVRTLGGIFGQLCTAGTNAVWLPAAATYTNVFSSATNNVVAISTNEFYGAPTVAGTQPGNTPALTNIIDGWYKINIHASFLGQSSGAYEFEVFTNSVACEACAVPHNCDNPARTTSCSASHICYLPAGCRVDLRVKGGATETIGLNRASLIITSP